MDVRISSHAVKSFELNREDPQQPVLLVRPGLLPDTSLLELMAALAPVACAAIQAMTG